MPLSFEIADNEWASATGKNVYSGGSTSQFDYPPLIMNDMTITAHESDLDPRVFEVGDTYDLSYTVLGTNVTLNDAVVIRSDAAPGDGGVIVFEGTNNFGHVEHLVWTPGFDLEGWYWDNYVDNQPPGFYVYDTQPSYNHSYICFSEDARIATALGGIRAGDIWEGDRVLTRDGGPQPVKWVGRRTVPGRGANAPVLFAPGTIGNHSPLRLSQQHRVLLCSPMAELMFGAPEVLVPAKALVNGEDVRLAPCRRITYVHLLLGVHHILDAEGAPCESLLPGDMAQEMAPDIPARFCAPVVSARPVLSYGEALVLTGTPRPPAEATPGPAPAPAAAAAVMALL